jgi:hypothetical protein
MLFFLLLLQPAPADPEPVAEPAFPRILDLVATERAQGDCDPGRRYRLDVNEARGEDARQRALRGEWRACATTEGAVCPTTQRTPLRGA